MSISGYWLQRQIAVCLMLFLVAPFAEAAIARPQQTGSAPSAEGVHSVPPQSGNASSTGSNSQAAPSLGIPSSGTPQSSTAPKQNGTSNPVGTAAAPYEKTTGAAVSRPAGAVIAPAKQKRARSILIRVGVLVGAAVAIGTVVALSKASPSRPH